MKKLIVMGIIALMITGLSVAANAYAGVTLNVAPVYGGGSYQTVQLGWLTDDGTGNPTTNAADIVDGGGGPAINRNVIEMDIVNSAINGGVQVNGDWRAPVANTSTSYAIWRLKVTMPQYPQDPDTQEILYGPISFGLDAQFTPGMGLTNNAKIYLLDGSFTSQSAAAAKVGTASELWAAPIGDAGHYTSAAGAFLIPAPTPVDPEDPSAGYNTALAYKYFTVYAVGVQAPVTTPEPGSMLAMFSGLVGLVGFGIRRRK